MKEYSGMELWLKIFNTDLEEAYLSMNDLEKDFQDGGSDEENAEIVASLEGKNISNILDDYFQYHGNGIYASDLKYLLIDLLDLEIEDIRGLDE